jgi:nucleoside-diphosphate-sugar epimerase
MRSAPVLALAGNDSWLRNIVAGRLAASTPVRNIGVGSSTLFDVETLVYVPALVPTSKSGSRDVNLAAASLTLAAAASSKVRRLVLVSRVGKQSGPADSYLGALELLEHKARDACAKVTVIRTTHPFGDCVDPGPVIGSLHRLNAIRLAESLGEVEVQPVYVEDLVDVIAAAVDGRLSAGVVEVGGPSTMTMGEFAALAREAGCGRFGSRRRQLFGRSSARPLTEFLAIDSVVTRRLASPLDGPRHDISEVW